MREHSLSGPMSIVFAIITICLLLSAAHGGASSAAVLYLPLSIIFCCLTVGSGCVSLGKGKWSGYVGIAILIVFVVVMAALNAGV